MVSRAIKGMYYIFLGWGNRFAKKMEMGLVGLLLGGCAFYLVSSFNEKPHKHTHTHTLKIVMFG